MELITVESSMIKAAGYDAADQELEVVFKNGKVYRYKGVPQPVYDALLAADSKGQYMRDQIIGHYPDQQVSRRQRS
jgi:hypothetical protein